MGSICAQNRGISVMWVVGVVGFQLMIQCAPMTREASERFSPIYRTNLQIALKLDSFFGGH